MNYYYYLLMLLVIVKPSIGQNLVPNGSFEDFNLCPHGPGNIDNANGWSTYRESPDYFNVCSVIPNMGVPSNDWGYQNALDGVAYAGLATYDVQLVWTAREYIGAALNQPLVVGTKYFVSAYISRGNSSYTNGATNKFGFRFSTVPYDLLNPAPVDNFSHVHSDSLITDSINWTRIEGSFIADSMYQYIIIGNFYDNSSTDTVDLLGYSALYYLDLVCVSTDSLDCPVITKIDKYENDNSISLFPNPFNSQLNISIKEIGLYRLILYDMSSQKREECMFNTSTTLSTKDIISGIYFYEIYRNDEILKKGKLVKL